jgi:hypothetical protein
MEGRQGIGGQNLSGKAEGVEGKREKGRTSKAAANGVEA